MKDNHASDGVSNRLSRLVQSGVLPSRTREQAERLIERLDNKVRVVLLGPKGVGKTSLLSALVGQLIAEPPSSPLTPTYGESEEPKQKLQRPVIEVCADRTDADNANRKQVIHQELDYPGSEHLRAILLLLRDSLTQFRHCTFVVTANFRLCFDFFQIKAVVDRHYRVILSVRYRTQPNTHQKK